MRPVRPHAGRCAPLVLLARLAQALEEARRAPPSGGAVARVPPAGPAAGAVH